MAKLIIQPCPFCGSDELHIIDILIDDNVYDAIECRDCGMIFSSCDDTERELWNAWNKRVVVSRNATTTPERTTKVYSIMKDIYHCKACDEYVIDKYSYCPSCGSKLMWDDEL